MRATQTSFLYTFLPSRPSALTHTTMSDKLTRIALVSADKCKPKKCVLLWVEAAWRGLRALAWAGPEGQLPLSTMELTALPVLLPFLQVSSGPSRF